MMGILLLGFGLLGLVASMSLPPPAERCLTKNGQLYTLLSTMTPYDRIRGDIPQFQDCKAKGLWAFVRHGTRFPHDFESKRYQNLTTLRDVIVENHNQNRGELCPEDVEGLKNWELVVDYEQSMLLTSSGVEELRRFGMRMLDGFKHLLEEYSPSKVDVRITSSERTRQSAQAFLTGLYKYSMKIPNTMVYDSLLKNEKNCTAWEKSTNSKKLKTQQELLQNSAEMRKLIREVTRRLGLQTRLDFDTVKDMYDICSFEYAWYHNEKSTPWCAIFTEEDLKLLEFNEDLRYFYKSAYGNNLTTKLGCSHIKDMLDKLSQGTPSSSLYFGHSMGMRKLLTTLGLAEDTKLSGDDYGTSDDRMWRTSYLTPFAANIVAVRYECGEGSHGIKEKSRLAFFVNEKLHKLPACGGRQMCGLDEFRREFSSIISQDFCNRDFCEMES